MMQLVEHALAAAQQKSVASDREILVEVDVAVHPE
jgi:hypothetical protein